MLERFPCEISDKVYLYIHAPCRGICALDKCELYYVLIVTRVHGVEVQYTDFENRASRKFLVGSGCGSDGWAVASDTWDPQFEFHHQQNFIYQL